MASSSIIVVGGSIGALEAVRTIAAGLRSDLSAAIFVVIHTSPDSPGVVDRILTRAGPMPAHYAVDGEPITPGRIFIAPPDRHLLVHGGFVRVTRGPREHRFRPAIDPLFRTAAESYRGVIGVILSGGLNDGIAGLAAVKRTGGVSIVQDPDDAFAPALPEAALRHADADHVLPARAIAPKLSDLVRTHSQIVGVTMATPPHRRDPAESGADDIHRADELGPPSPFTCPDCGGTLWQYEEGELVQFRCHVGHRFTAESLNGAQSEALDEALWAALRALEESAEFRRRMAVRARDRGMAVIADTFAEQARESEARAVTIRRLLMPESAARTG
jgi:two-component system, chemotaxis family, protein-glutamate methylesterase/glutaminase